MKTVLIIANEWTTIVHFRMEILQGLLDAGYKVFVALPVCDETDVIKEIGCELINLDVSRHGTNPVQDFTMFLECRKILKTLRPDVVVTYTVKPNIYASYACALENIPYINNVTGVGSVLQKKSVVADLMLTMMRLAFKKSRCVFFQNEDNHARFLKEKVIKPETPAEILPGSGVNLDKFRYCPYPDDSTVKFVIVSRVRKDKGYAEFLDSAKKIKAKRPETEFHVVGWYEDQNLKSRLDELDERKVIIYHGSLPQKSVYEVVRSCSCLVHPSYHEGMANVILEAAATGRPVIASDISGCKEAVEDGKTGFLCEVKSTDSLAEAMERFLGLTAQQRDDMGRAGRVKMERDFSREIVLNKLLKKLEEIVNA